MRHRLKVLKNSLIVSAMVNQITKLTIVGLKTIIVMFVGKRVTWQ